MMEESRDYYIEKFKAAREKREYFLYSKNVEEMVRFYIWYASA